jgi:hypothetical protein
MALYCRHPPEPLPTCAGSDSRGSGANMTLNLPRPLPDNFLGGSVLVPGLGQCDVIECFVCKGTGVPLPKHPVQPPCPNCAGYGWHVYSAGKTDRAMTVTAVQRLISEDRARRATGA